MGYIRLIPTPILLAFRLELVVESWQQGTRHPSSQTDNVQDDGLRNAKMEQKYTPNARHPQSERGGQSGLHGRLESVGQIEERTELVQTWVHDDHGGDVSDHG